MNFLTSLFKPKPAPPTDPVAADFDSVVPIAAVTAADDSPRRAIPYSTPNDDTDDEYDEYIKPLPKPGYTFTKGHKYETDDNDELVFISDKYKLNGDLIREVVYNNPTKPLAEKDKKAHIVIAILAHGNVLPDDLPTDLSENTLVWSLSSTNGLSLGSQVKVTDEEYRDTKTIQEVVATYAKKLLWENYPILNVLNSLRQHFTRKKTPYPPPIDGDMKEMDFYRNANSTPVTPVDAMRRYPTLKLIADNSDIEVNGKAIARFEKHYNTNNGKEDTTVTSFNAKRIDEKNEDIILGSVSQRMVSQNKFAYIHTQTRDMIYKSDKYSVSANEERNEENRLNVPLNIKVLDVRYPTNTGQIYLRTRKGEEDLQRQLFDLKLIEPYVFRHQILLSQILTFLKKEMGFNYVTIIETTCRYRELPDVQTEYTGDERIQSNMKRYAYDNSKDEYSRQRKSADRFIKKVGYGSFGGSARSRRKHKRGTRSRRKRRYSSK